LKIMIGFIHQITNYKNIKSHRDEQYEEI
jgi:hypothetical protein